MLIANKQRTHFTLAASYGPTNKLIGVGDVLELDPLLPPVQSILSNTVINMADMREGDGYKAGHPISRHMYDVEGIRGLLMVPLSRGGQAIGCIALNRKEIAQFSEDEVSLVQGFAAQANIAIENVRQFRELQTRLEREAATREILSVISRSRDDEQPVFDVISELSLIHI